MLERKKKRTFDPRSQIVIDESSSEITNSQEITHVVFGQRLANYPEGAYSYNPRTQILTTLDDEMLGILSFEILMKASKMPGEKVKFLRHIPTWNKLVADGRIHDNRTVKEEDTIDVDHEEVIEVQLALPEKTPKRRSLGI